VWRIVSCNGSLVRLHDGGRRSGLGYADMVESEVNEEMVKYNEEDDEDDDDYYH